MATKYKSVDATTAKRIFDGGAHMIDLRNEDDWASGHVEGADRVSPASVGPQSVGRADTVIVVDLTGSRSKRAAKKLAKQGYRVYHLDGGLRAWEEAGLPLRSSTGDRPRVS